MKDLSSAILGAMKQIGYLQRDKEVGAGKNAYKGLTDQKATGAIREALIANGIIAIQTAIEEETSIERWQEKTQYGSKAKLHIFTRVKVTFTLIHADSGESLQAQAIGHGIDSGDKAAGKAMTYAKKNALLNCLLVSTGLDADDTHNNDLPAPAPPKSNAGKGYDKDSLSKINENTGSQKQRELIAKLLASSKFDDLRDKIINALNAGTKTASETIEYLQNNI